VPTADAANTSEKAVAAFSALPDAIVTFEDDFSDPASGWPVEDISQRKMEYVDGEYRILTRSPGFYVSATSAKMPYFNDFSVHVDARAVAGASGLEYAVAFGTSGSRDFYYFGVDPSDRTYNLRRRQPDGWINLVPRRPSPAVRAGGLTNVLGVEREGTNVALYLNGERITAVRAVGIPAGQVILMVNNLAASGGAAAHFDNLVITGDALPTETPTPSPTVELTATATAEPPSPTATETAVESQTPDPPTDAATATEPAATPTASESAAPDQTRLYLPALARG
jgi:hypothetical protein